MREPRRVPVSASIRLQTTAFGSFSAIVVTGAAGDAGITEAGTVAVAGVAVTAEVAGATAVSALAASECEDPNAANAASANARLRKIFPLQLLWSAHRRPKLHR